jgi:hypothetical protein
VLQTIRTRLTYGNITATLALFIALGGTSYALTRNSIGARELRPHSVGASELRTGAVTARDIRNRGISLADLSRSARAALRGAVGPVGPQGPSGVNYFARVNSAGAVTGGNADHWTPVGTNGAVIYFARSVASCGYSATLARIVDHGPVADPAPGSTITVASNGDGGVLVRTWDAGKAETALPFHLIVAC